MDGGGAAGSLEDSPPSPPPPPLFVSTKYLFFGWCSGSPSPGSGLLAAAGRGGGGGGCGAGADPELELDVGRSRSGSGGLWRRYLNFIETYEDELWAGCGVDDGELESEDLRRLSTSVAYATSRSKPDEIASCHSCRLGPGPGTTALLLSTDADGGPEMARRKMRDIVFHKRTMRSNMRA